MFWGYLVDVLGNYLVDVLGDLVDVLGNTSERCQSKRLDLVDVLGKTAFPSIIWWMFQENCLANTR